MSEWSWHSFFCGMSVLDAHKDTIRILHTLTPIGVVMAGKDEYDPYKD